VISLVYSLAAPLLLLPIEKLLPYPYLIEELVKYILVSLIVRDKSITKQHTWLYVLFAGLLFTFTESFLYIFNIMALGRYGDFPARIVFTGILHAGTMLLMFWGIRRGKFTTAITFLVAVAMHFFFNFIVSSYFF